MQINWKMIMHLATTKEHSLLYRADYKGKGVQREIHTPVREHCKERFGKPKEYFFIDGDKREFKTEEELLKALESEGLKMIEKKKTNADKIRSMTDEELANLLSTAWNKADYDDDDYDPAWLEWLRMSPEEAQEFAKVKADGRLVVLPCKVGTRVWVIGQNCDMCCDMYAEEPCLFGDCEYKGVFESIFSIGMTDKFGKTVFLTREEAEKALEGLK